MPSITVSNYEATVKLHQMVRKNGNGIVRLVGQVIYYKWLVASSFGNCGNSCSQRSGNRVWEWEKKNNSPDPHEGRDKDAQFPIRPDPNDTLTGGH